MVVGKNILEVVLAVPTVVGEDIFEVFLTVRTVVGENILDVRILEKMTNHFLRPPYKRPGSFADRNPIRANLGTFLRRSEKVVGHFFEDTYVQNIFPYPRGDS